MEPDPCPYNTFKSAVDYSKDTTLFFLVKISLYIYTELILGLRPANGRRCYFVATSLIGWAQASTMFAIVDIVLETHQWINRHITYQHKPTSEQTGIEFRGISEEWDLYRVTWIRWIKITLVIFQFCMFALLWNCHSIVTAMWNHPRWYDRKVAYIDKRYFHSIRPGNSDELSHFEWNIPITFICHALLTDVRWVPIRRQAT